MNYFRELDNIEGKALALMLLIFAVVYLVYFFFDWGRELKGEIIEKIKRWKEEKEKERIRKEKEEIENIKVRARQDEKMKKQWAGYYKIYPWETEESDKVFWEFLEYIGDNPDAKFEDFEKSKN